MGEMFRGKKRKVWILPDNEKATNPVNWVDSETPVYQEDLKGNLIEAEAEILNVGDTVVFEDDFYGDEDVAYNTKSIVLHKLLPIKGCKTKSDWNEDKKAVISKKYPRSYLFLKRPNLIISGNSSVQPVKNLTVNWETPLTYYYKDTQDININSFSCNLLTNNFVNLTKVGDWPDWGAGLSKQNGPTDNTRAKLGASMWFCIDFFDASGNPLKTEDGKGVFIRFTTTELPFEHYAYDSSTGGKKWKPYYEMHQIGEYHTGHVESPILNNFDVTKSKIPETSTDRYTFNFEVGDYIFPVGAKAQISIEYPTEFIGANCTINDFDMGYQGWRPHWIIKKEGISFNCYEGEHQNYKFNKINLTDKINFSGDIKIAASKDLNFTFDKTTNVAIPRVNSFSQAGDFTVTTLSENSIKTYNTPCWTFLSDVRRVMKGGTPVMAGTIRRLDYMADLQPEGDTYRDFEPYEIGM